MGWRQVIAEVIKPLFDDVLKKLQQGDNSLVPVLCDLVLGGLKQLRDKHFSVYMPEIFPLLCKLVTVKSPEVRLMVQEILLDRICPMWTGLSAQANGTSRAGTT